MNALEKRIKKLEEKIHKEDKMLIIDLGSGTSFYRDYLPGEKEQERKAWANGGIIVEFDEEM